MRITEQKSIKRGKKVEKSMGQKLKENNLRRAWSTPTNVINKTPHYNALDNQEISGLLTRADFNTLQYAEKGIGWGSRKFKTLGETWLSKKNRDYPGVFLKGTVLVLGGKGNSFSWILS